MQNLQSQSQFLCRFQFRSTFFVDSVINPHIIKHLAGRLTNSRRKEV
ncbi:hypothetical protein QQP08_001717 [Theobroma cacao]|nr:hypothetical protein QQP08_001717 [Theobroma cacao]